jgi:FixJ family two-component response regulator
LTGTEILIVDDDEDLRQALADLIEMLCHRGWLSAASAADVVALGPRALACGLAILDVNLGAGRPSGLDVLKWLRQHGFTGKVIFLTGHARTHPEVARARAVEGVPLFGKPLAAEPLLELIEETP